MGSYSIVSNMSNSQLDDLIESIKIRRKELSRGNINTFGLGEKVFFQDGGLRYFGTIEKINKTRVVIKMDESNFKNSGKRYSVPANMISKITIP